MAAIEQDICPKCGKPLQDGDEIIVVSEAIYAPPGNSEAPDRHPSIYFMAHSCCFDGIVDSEVDDEIRCMHLTKP